MIGLLYTRPEDGSAQSAANALKDKYVPTSGEYKGAQDSIDAYGAAGVKNGVTIEVAANGNGSGSVLIGDSVAKTGLNPNGQNITATFDPGHMGGDLIAHEGVHVGDASAWVASGFAAASQPFQYAGEFKAYAVQASIWEGAYLNAANQSPPFVGESDTRIFLELQNRRASSIFVEAFDLGGKDDDSALADDVFTGGTCREQQRPDRRGQDVADRPLTMGYSSLHGFSLVNVPPGTPFLFVVPLDHLSDSRCVRIRYWTDSEAAPRPDRVNFLWFGPKGTWPSRLPKKGAFRDFSGSKRPQA